METTPRLERSLTLPVFVAYGVGTMVGAGFYALLGEVAGRAGLATPVAFLVSGGVAALSAISFAALGARFPVSAGEAHFVRVGFGARWLAPVVGWLVIATGLVSAAALANAFARFLGDLAPVPHDVGVALVVLVLGGVAAWGIRASTWLAVSITIIELLGLVWVLAVTGEHLVDLPARLPEIMGDATAGAGVGLFGAAFLSFYAFVGFEDMVNLAEEVVEPRRNLPRGILIALVVTMTLYILVATSAVLAVAPAELAEASTPLARLVGGDGGASFIALTIISLLTGVNGALIQIVMAARVMYGLATAKGAPRALGVVHPRRKTPVRATLLATGIVLVLALTFDIVALAEGTSAVILVVFTLVNASLWRIRTREIRDASAPPGVPCPPRWQSALGVVTCLALLATRFL